MHPVILWGYRTRRVSLGPLTYVCPRCHANCPHVVVKQQSKLSLFFVPLVPLAASYVAVCTNCRYEERVTKQQARQLFPGQA